MITFFLYLGIATSFILAILLILGFADYLTKDNTDEKINL